MLVSKCPKCGDVGQEWCNFGETPWNEECHSCDVKLDLINENEITDPQIFLLALEREIESENCHSLGGIAEDLYNKILPVIQSSIVDPRTRYDVKLAQIIKDEISRMI